MDIKDHLQIEFPDYLHKFPMKELSLTEDFHFSLDELKSKIFVYILLNFAKIF